MPYRPRKTTHSTTGATPLASKMSAMPATGAWVHDAETGITSYTANPSQYLDSDEKTKGKPRFKVLYGKRTPRPRRKAWKPDPKVYAASIGALYPMAGNDPLADGRPTHAQTMLMDAKTANADPRLRYHLLNNVEATQADLNKAKALADYRAMHWFFK